MSALSMKCFVDAILTCQSTGIKKEKRAALENLDDVAKRLCVEALSPYRVFGVKKYDAPSKAGMYEDPTPFFTLLDQLASRELTGNAAKNAVTSTLEMYSEETQPFLRLILGKDLRAGFSADTLNEIYPDLVPTFSVMLAEKLTDKYDWQFPMLAEYKYDGERTIAICENGDVSYWSRSGKPADHCNGLFDADLKAMEKAAGYPIVVDGERYASNFTETLNAKKAGNDKAKENLRIRAYDFMSLADWKAKRCQHTQKVRRAMLESTLGLAKCQKITLSIGKIINTLVEAREYFQAALNEKFEGLILKRLNGLYEWERSENWTKYKPCYSFDGRIVGFYAGRKGTRLEDTLGGIDIKGVDENGVEFEASVGSGFDDETRAYFWSHQNELLGAMVEVESQEMSQNASTKIFSLRFPVFVRIRDDK